MTTSAEPRKTSMPLNHRTTSLHVAVPVVDGYADGSPLGVLAFRHHGRTVTRELSGQQLDPFMNPTAFSLPAVFRIVVRRGPRFGDQRSGQRPGSGENLDRCVGVGSSG